MTATFSDPVSDPAPAAVIKDVLYPNVAIRFLGWVDQSTTDFNKGRSQAIAAVKKTLEENGLATPDPIMRVRMEGDEAAAKPAASPEPSRAEDDDVSPEKIVTRMVARERAKTSAKKDLLDSSRPEE